jgi:hypothetical protein
MFREILWPRVGGSRLRQKSGPQVPGKSDSTASIGSLERPLMAPPPILSSLVRPGAAARPGDPLEGRAPSEAHTCARAREAKEIRCNQLRFLDSRSGKQGRAGRGKAIAAIGTGQASDGRSFGIDACHIRSPYVPVKCRAD